MTRPLIVFDMDGVLVEVTESYRESIRQTVGFFTNKPVTYEMIQAYKNAGGWNNDWKLSHKMASDLGTEVDYQKVIDYFQEVFLGAEGNGLITREKWIARPGTLESLNAAFDFGIYTGRPEYEASLTLNRLSNGVQFAPIMTADHVSHGKPHPEGLEKIKTQFPGRQLWYIGDTVDDARCARGANVPFIAVTTQPHSVFADEQAVAILDDINQLEAFFANRSS